MGNIAVSNVVNGDEMVIIMVYKRVYLLSSGYRQPSVPFFKRLISHTVTIIKW